MRKYTSMAISILVVIATLIGFFAVNPQIEKERAISKAETMSLDCNEDGSVSRSDSVYQESCSPTDSITLKSNKKITSGNVKRFLEVDSYLGEIPEKFSVNEISEGYYEITPETEMTAGLYYDFTAKNGASIVAEGSEEIETVTKRIEKSETSVVDLNADIVYLDWDDVEGSTAESITSVDSSIAEDLQKGSVLCLMDGYNEWKEEGSDESELHDLYNDNTLFTRVEKIGDDKGESTEIKLVDADAEDVYENVDVYVEQQIDPEDMFDMEQIEQAIAGSEGTEQMTELLAAAISQDDTVLQLLEGEGPESTSYFRNGISYENGKSISLGSKMLEGMTVKAVLSNSAENANFPVANPDGWSAFEISICYEMSIGRYVKISAEVKITQYLNLSMQGGKTWDGSDLDFDYAMNMYSQTNFDVTVLVCSSNNESKIKGNTKPEGSTEEGTNWFDISESIKGHLTEESTDSENIIAQMQEMLDNNGDYIELVNVPIVQSVYEVIPILPVFQVNLKLDYVLKINFAAGISSQLTVLDAVQIGMEGSTEGGNKGVRSYKHELAGADRFSYDI